MLAKELIDRLERLGLLDQEIIAALREQLEQSGSRVTPEAIAKLLVDNGQLTRFQATKMIGELRSDQYDDDDAAEEEGDAPAEDLTFLEEDGESEEEAIADAVPIATAMPVEAVSAEPVDETDLSSMPQEMSSQTIRRPSGPDHSIWDSFKVYGRAGIVLALLLAGGALYFVLSKEDATEFIKQADKLFDQQNYQPAQDRYIKFLDGYGEDHQFASRSRTRIALTKLFRARALPDPTVGIDVADKELPTIANEEALDDDRADLAALLVDIAENVANAADKSDSTTEKQSLLAKLDAHNELMQNPLYISSQTRVTLGSRLAGIAETRSRVQREINRNLQLDAAVVAMESALDQKETKLAYDTRFSLLKDFPELLDNERLDELIRKASTIQQTLVERSSEKPTTTEEPVQTDSLVSVALTNSIGDSVPGLRGEIVYLRANGSVLAFAAETGKLLWRKYVGQTQTHPPVRIDRGTGVLLSNGERQEVANCDGETGDLLWRTTLGEPFDIPVVGGERVYVAGQSGKLYALDQETGKSDWVTEIPQSLEVGPGLDTRSKKLYIPGDHSNLYVLNSRDGSCLESHYIGHDQGTIRVPPLPLLGHLFVIENTTASTAKVHVLKFNQDGTGLEQAQAPFQLLGNVTVPPILQKRRFIALTDLGQVSVFDIEPTAEREKVSVIAQGAPVYKNPTSARMTADRSQMWITGTRIARFELQINTGQVVRDWVKHEGDAFITRPIAFEDALIHARVLRGTSGVRVTAVAPKTGQRIWQTDVGVGISMIRQVPQQAAFHAITSQGAMFRADRAAIESGRTEGPIEDPGGDGVTMRFTDPIPFMDGDQPTNDRVLFNQQQTSEILLYQPNRRSDLLRKVTIRLPDNAKLGGGAIYAGGGLLVPLDSGRLVLMRPDTGANLGSPFQPNSDPTGKVQWSDPVRTADDPDQIVIADSRKQLYRLRIGAQIRELSRTELEFPLLGPTARIGGTMVGAFAGPSADSIIGFDMGTLETTFQTLLDGRVQWGPKTAEDASFCLLQTDDGILRAFDASGQQTFQLAIPPGDIVSAPTKDSDRWILVGADGWILSIDPEAGEIDKQFDLEQPISAAPLSVGNGRLLVPGREGVIYLINL